MRVLIKQRRSRRVRRESNREEGEEREGKEDQGGSCADLRIRICRVGRKLLLREATWKDPMTAYRFKYDRSKS